MGNKINFQQLAKTLAQKKNLSQKDAEAFLKEFFDSIIQNVTTDKLVKIKGLGTFKLIEVLDRESVNVNTGERFIIPGHSKLSFTPETALKDLINKPFADFQTTIINEGTSLEEMEKVPLEEQEEYVEPEEEQEALTPASQPEEVKKEPEEEKVPVQQLVEVPVDQVPLLYGPRPVTLLSDSKPRPFAKIAAWAAGILLLCLLCFFAGRHLSRQSSSDATEQAEPQVETPAETPAEEIE
ncbi:MAG: HU family DNA-binding protein, partial [Bacteroidaceae bacterium]|nr:HU family DNA-binding protein [Bacteroidaceae bacterium]